MKSANGAAWISMISHVIMWIISKIEIENIKLI